MLLGVSIWRIFPLQAYTIMFLQHYNSQQDSQHIYMSFAETGERMHTLDKLNSSTKTTGILHFILSKLIIQRCWAPAFLTSSSGAASWVLLLHSKDIYHWHNKEDIIWVMTWRGLILQDAKCFLWFESDSCVAVRSVNTTIHIPSLPCLPLCDVCSQGLFLTLECNVFGVKITSFYTFVK